MAGQHRPDHRQILTGHRDGAGLEVEVQHLLHVVLQHSVGFQQKGQGPVFVAGVLFRQVHVLVQLDVRVSRQLPGQLQQTLELLLIAGPMNEPADGDGPHVHHGVQVVAEQGLVGHIDGVKGLAGGLHPHPGADILLPVVHQGQQQQDGLDDTLDGKGLVPVSGVKVLPVAAQHVDAQVVQIGLGQFGDVGGYLSLAGVGAALLQKFF